MNRLGRVATSPTFTLAVGVLLLNDFYLKDAFPGLITGKVSDFAGLFAFSMLVAAFMPRRAGYAYTAVAAAFVWWKSPLSEGTLAEWNTLTAYDLRRVVDYTDWIALLALPLSYASLQWAAQTPLTSVRRRLMPITFVIAAFAFGASSFEGKSYEFTPDDPATTYDLGFAQNELTQRLDATGLWHSATADGSIVVLLDESCRRAFVREMDRDTATMSLVALAPGLNCTRDGKGAQRDAFEEDLVTRLRGERDPRETKKVPRGERVGYAGLDAFTLPLGISLDRLRCALDGSLQLHRLQQGIYTQDLGWGFFARFQVIETTAGVELKVVEYIDGFDGESTVKQLEERFAGFIDYVTSSQTTPASPPQISSAPNCADS